MQLHILQGKSQIRKGTFLGWGIHYRTVLTWSSPSAWLLSEAGHCSRWLSDVASYGES